MVSAGDERLGQSQTFLRNVSWLTIAFITSRGLSLVWQLLLAKILTHDTELFGRFSVLLSLLAIFSVFAEMGIPLIMQKHWSEGVFSKLDVFSTCLRVRLSASFFSLLAFVPSIFLLYEDLSIRQGVVILAPALIIGGFQSSISTSLEVSQQMKKVAMLNISQAALNFITQGGAVYFDTGLVGLCFGVLVSQALTLAFAVRLGAGENARFSGIFKSSLPVRLFAREGFPVMVSALSYLIFYRIDSVMLSKYVSLTSAGVITISALLFSGLTDLVWSQAARALYPILAAVWHEDNSSRKQLFLSSISRAYLTITSFLLILAVLLGRPVLSMVFTRESSWFQSLLPLIILLCSMWFLTLYGLSYRILVLENRRGWFARSVVFGTLCKICLSFLLIPKLELVGAALATAISQLIMTITLIAGLSNWKTELIDLPKLIAWIAVVVLAIGYFEYSNLYTLLVLIGLLPYLAYCAFGQYREIKIATRV